MATLTYRNAAAAGLRQEMLRDESVILLGEDVAKAGGVFKTSRGLYDEFGAQRVFDTPIAEQAILGAALGAAMTGMRPVAEIMFADFLAVCWDYVVNEIPKARYMTAGQFGAPLVIRAANGAGIGFGPQHSQAVETWAMTVPGLKIVSPSTPADMKGLMAAAIRDDDPVLVLESKALLATKGEVPDGELVIPLGQAAVRRTGQDLTIAALGSTVPTAQAAAAELAAQDIDATVIDLRSVVPLDAGTVLASVAETGRLVVVEEAPAQLGWGASVASLVGEEAFGSLRAPVRRVCTANVPVPGSRRLEERYLPEVHHVVDAAVATVSYVHRSFVDSKG
ncbi:alpha-ketoacid dehydrogenase subunit beta [Pseudonocardia ailaonensis]|uniref:Alpha-ketoacid dehydrogenase subunit beta n=1 Tax=Pseudonocardia ailaonensis TaxID=367279 RepID=A0ABN2N6F5_9PSEU